MTTQENAVAHEHITLPSVKKFLTDYGITHPDDFSKLNALCHNPSDSSYLRHVVTFHFQQPVETVWNAYKNIPPARVWGGSMINFGLQYARYDNSVTYSGTGAYDGLKAGQVLILNLSLLNGLINLCIGHEVMEVNEPGKFVRICYLENSTSQGSQFVRLSPAENGGTKIIHETFYKSGSWFRDRVLYPGLHTKALKEFHGNVRKYLEIEKVY
ncbi:MAG: hypothetical protein KF845_13615 [Cyclobacteriaceae bacterium]|nr:hypothetical protein [Cyclobacteriaceae bacterium]